MDQVCNMHVEDIFLKLLWWTENIGVFIVPILQMYQLECLGYWE